MTMLASLRLFTCFNIALQDVLTGDIFTVESGDCRNPSQQKENGCLEFWVFKQSFWHIFDSLVNDQF